MLTLSRLQSRSIARWLVAALLFSVLHPALAAGLAVAQGSGGLVQICTGAGMTWVRLVDRTADPVAEVVSQAAGQVVTPNTAPDDGDSAASVMSPCPFCLGAALAPGGSGAVAEPFDWPPQASFARASQPRLTPASERVILDAPTRGPPGVPSIA